ncbi:hypothetical protein GCM10011613_27990 [Cellvibrio zantedeschiae]|uniref:Lipoprotein n=1 Tax=Cellvibrio zantedeschiae TaxID=1237077 RepID=A0ABQ3B6C8_9GAMM|nr:hypothetical protein [Cellvibrio zantedeschiae]GGY81703.1 hypothetical protein GCM10011613_27990 [Cellvibrio zantedeschiae]
MKNLMSVCAFSLLLLASCGQSSKENQQEESEAPAAETSASPSGEPITLHARLDFVDSYASPAINSSRKLNASIYIEMDVTREGSGASASFALDSETSRVQGSLVASGSSSIKLSEGSADESYDMHNEWSALTTQPEGKFMIKLPEPSLLGEGFSVGVEIEAPVNGTKKAAMADTEIMHARPMFCASHEADKSKDVCKLEFTIDAVPTKDPGVPDLLESAKGLYAYQGKIGPEGGLIMYSGMVPVYGATTHYHNGHFVTELDQEYNVNLKDANIGQHIHLVVWSTKRGDKWQPEGLPPLKKPETLQ